MPCLHVRWDDEWDILRGIVGAVVGISNERQRVGWDVSRYVLHVLYFFLAHLTITTWCATIQLPLVPWAVIQVGVYASSDHTNQLTLHSDNGDTNDQSDRHEEF